MGQILGLEETKFSLEILVKSEFTFLYIKKTCPCNEYPLKPHFHIVKLGYAGVYLFFLILLQNIDRRGGSNVYPQSMF